MEVNTFIQQLVQIQVPGISQNDLEYLETCQEINKFMSDMNLTTLFICFQNNQITILNELDQTEYTHCFLLSKIKPAVITRDNFGEMVRFLPMGNSPISALYQTLHSLFPPVFQKGHKFGVTPKLQNLLSELEQGLMNSLVQPNSSQREHLGFVHSIGDEYSFWAQDAEHAPSKVERDRAGFFRDALKCISSDYDRFSHFSFPELMEIIEKTHDVLDELWRQQDHDCYPQERMSHLLDIITSDVVGCVQHRLSDYDLIKDSVGTVMEPLRGARQVCDSFLSTCDTLTAKIWPNTMTNKWNGDAFVCPHLAALADRLCAIMDIRNSHEILIHLLSNEEQNELRVKDCFSPFVGLNPLSCSKYSTVKWSEAIERYRECLMPIEKKAALKLQGIFAALHSQPSQLLREFQKYKEIVKRKAISDQLQNEKEMLLTQLTHTIKVYSTEYQDRLMNHNNSATMNMTPLISNIIWARQIISKLGETDAIVSAIGIPKSTYQSISSTLFEDLCKFERDQFDTWVDDVTQLMKDPNGELILQKSGKLMELNFETGKLEVNYGSQLVTLLREVRQLLSMGFPVPSVILKVSENGQKFYRHGIVLQQVANFYNTIDKQMLPCQQAMLLNPALHFESVVKNPFKGSGGVATWDNPKDLEIYVSKLQSAAEKLTSENRKLRKFHEVITEYVKSLVSTDLVKNQSKWKDVMNSIRGVLNLVTEGGIKEEETLGWRVHWDYQLYKALELQYKLGLESLSESLPEMKVEIVFKQNVVQFRPSLEEIKAKYYREMKKFINLPNSFKSIGNTSIFKKIADLSASSLESVYTKAETLFGQLHKSLDIYKEWLVLGANDLEGFVEEALLDVSDWEMNFRLVKQKGKDVEQLPSVIKIDCITISAVPVKASIDDHLQRVFDALLGALRKATNGHLKEIDQFTNTALDILMKRPQTMAEIGHANSVHAELTKNRISVLAHFDQAEQKNKLLKSVSGSGVDTALARAKWSKLEMMLESHEMMIKEQVESLRGAIDSRIQNFLNELEKFSLRWHQLKPKPAETTQLGTALKAIEFIDKKATEFAEIETSMNQILEDCIHFEIEKPEFKEFKDLKDDIELSRKSWGLCQSYWAEKEELAKSDWITIRSKCHLLEDHMLRWAEKVRIEPIDQITTIILKDIDSYKNLIPNIKFVRGDSWMSEHWGEFFRLVSIKGVSLSELTFGHLMEARSEIVANISAIIALNSRADGEIAIREAMQELDIWGASAVFSLTDYQDAKQSNIKLIKEWKEVLTQVGDNQSLLQSLKDSPYFKNFVDRARTWEQRLSETDEYLRLLNIIQRKWVYLEPIFGKGALPSEQARFSRIDEDFRSIMSSVTKDPRVTSITLYSGIRNTLHTLTDQLDRCQKALNEFLEEKRSRFARFYFIGDDDLLEILGQSKNPEVIQNHLKKLFAGVHSVVFNDDYTKVVGMQSIQGERVDLKSPVVISSEVESWLEDFAKEMQKTLHTLLLECLESTEVLHFPTQVVGLSEYLHFTSNVESRLNAGKDLKDLRNSLGIQLEKYTSFDYDAIPEKTQRTVTELKIKSLILDVIHFIDVVDQLMAVQCKSVQFWEWRKQIKFYLNSSKHCIIRMHNAEFDYTYEYQGIPPKLVHTPLTDKCYLTLTQAMASGFGGNPFGPAGTGKTESVKALGVLFGRQVLVFNCDEGIDYKSMGRIFVGLVKCGAWGCFDEFNRLEEAVLSAVSQQIQVIQAGLKKKENNLLLLGKQVDLNQNSGIFVTLNPAGKGYGGRQKLPDNLKQLFRSVAMTHPDLDLISEVILLSEGFKQGKVLGSKVVSMFTLCKQFLTPQQHYDWGLRPMKAVLSLAGNLIHEARKKKESIDEGTIVVNALCASTVSKLTFLDVEKFLMLLQDLFPSVNIKEIEYSQLEEALKQTYKDLGLVYLEPQAKKVFQFYEACRQRMGVVLVGPSGSGKSTIWKLLEKTMAKIGKRIIIYRSNPKAVDRRALLGSMDLDTRSWNDGILTFASRQAVKEPLENHSWIVCDGDVDPEWIESLNSVLDDNRLLTMPNGERIQFGPNVNFIFETHDLKFASPATVSRMGMIYLSDETLDVSILVQKWISERHESLQKHVGQWVDDYLYFSLKWIQQNCQLLVDCSKTGLLFGAFAHMDMATDKLSFIFSLIRGLGSNLTTENRLKFANELLSTAGIPNPDPKRTLDYFASDGKAVLYQREEIHISDPSLMKDPEELPFVETVDLKRNFAVVMPWLKNQEPVILVGPEGCGKSTTLRYCFSKLRNCTVVTVNCSSQTKSQQILNRLYQACMFTTTAQGRVLRPKDSERMILYLKDINLPNPDKYETVEMIQFIQQLLTYKGFFNSELEWISVENIQIVTSMNPPKTMGRHPLSTRFSSILRVYYMDYPDKEQLSYIFRIFLEPVLDGSLPGHRVWSLPKNCGKLASTIMSIFEQTTQKFTVDVQPHYLFTPRDISKIIVSLGRYNVTKDDESEILEVVANELKSLFQDRLVDQESSIKFDTILKNSFQTDWSYQVNLQDIVFASVSKKSSIQILSNSGQLQKQELAEYKTFIASQLVQYEREVQELDLPLFPEILEKLSRLCATLGQRGGSALLAGRPGVPFQQMVALASFLLDYRLFSPRVSRMYSRKNFCSDLKQALQLTGIENQPALFLLEDYQVTDPSFLELVNSLLSGPEIGGIYAQEELDVIFHSLKDSFSQEGFTGSIYDFFLNRIRSNLHVVLISDTGSSDFVKRCESNPALYTRCKLQWIEKWSKDSMFSMINDTFAEPDLSCLNEKDILTSSMYSIHQSMPSSNPKHFSSFLKTYKSIYHSKKLSLQKKHQYLSGGLSKMREATEYVDKLSRDANIQQKELAVKQSQADLALKQITEAMVEAAEQKKEMETLQEKLKEEEVHIISRKQAVEIELAEVEPVIRSAKAAVGEIRSESLSEIRSLRAPPPAIRDVLEAVLRLMGNLDMSWNSMKSFLGQRTVKEEIMNFDVRSISKQTRDAVSELIKKNSNSFEESVIKRASVAAAPLAMWVKANIQYSIVAEKVAPLEHDLKRLTDSLEESKNRVSKLKAALSEVDSKVAALKEDFGSKTRDTETLKQGLERAVEVMQRAQSLLEKLSGEGKRWEDQSKEIEQALQHLPKDSVMSAAFVVYLAGSTEDKRNEMVRVWNNVCKLPYEYNFRTSMCTESEQLVWKAEGLPSDVLSAENAAIILASISTSLVVDPSGQSIEWLKKHLDAKKPEVVNYSDDNFVRSLELAIRFGKTLIVQEVRDIDPILFPLIRGTLQKHGSRHQMELGDKLIDFNENFKLYLVTKQSNFRLPSNVSGFINEVNFTITRAGLSGQLLGITIKHEQPTLEVQKTELLQKEEAFKIQLSELENRLLTELANAEGNILENQSLIVSLNDAKEKSSVVQNALLESKRLQASLDTERDKYTEMSSFGSTLYFAISELYLFNNMYRFSLSSFLHLYQENLEGDVGSLGVNERNAALMVGLEKLVFNHVSRSLFKEDLLAYALHLIHSLHPSLFEQNEWELFTGSAFALENDGIALDTPSWVPVERVGHFNRMLQAIPVFSKSLGLGDKETWSKWLQSSTPEAFMPKEKISAFQKLLLVQAFRPDRLLTAMTNFCTQIIGIDSLAPPQFSLDTIFKESNENDPILFITTPGADPSQELREFGRAQIGLDNFHEVAMGQGQGDFALELIREASRNGHWVCLQNIHLVITWIPALEKELLSIRPNSKFRLWLTSESHPKFPQSLLEKCLKVTVESPPGLKKNLKRIYDSWTTDMVGGNSVVKSQALFSLAWFHAVIQERRNYIPQGWNKFYEFSAADLRSSVDIINAMFLSGDSNIQWNILHGLLKDAVYGGRIDDRQDALKLETYLEQFFANENYHTDAKQPTQKLCKAFNLPRSTEIEAYRSIISDLPEADNVTWFGLPANIDRALQSNTSQSIISQLNLLKHSNVESQKYNKDLWSQQLNPFVQMWKKLTNDNDLLKKTAVLSDTTDPISSFLELEMQCGIHLIQRINQDLSNISRILRGTLLLSNDVKQIASSLLKGETPEEWMTYWEGPLQAHVYIEQVVYKTQAVIIHLEKARSGSFLEGVVQIDKVFNTIPFLNALRQSTSRKRKVPMDTLKLVASWDKSGTLDPLMIEGLLVQGCRCDGTRFTEAEATDPIFNTVPKFYLAWIPKDQQVSGFTVPIYTNATREKCVSNILVPFNQNQTPWILAGVAFFISAE